MNTKDQTRFSLGQVVATPGAMEAMQRTGANPTDYLRRHMAGDWGIVPKDDKLANEDALLTGARLMSAYFLPDETQLWVITDAEDDQGRRQATTLLLPEEY